MGVGSSAPAQEAEEGGGEGRSIGDDDVGSHTQGATRLLLKGEIPAGRMPGLVPFTTVEYEEPLSDQLYDSAMLHGWLSCIDRLSARRRERWCALHQNVLYEFEPQMGEMLLRAKHNLQGCVCYVPGDSADTFIVRTAGLFSTFGAKTSELEISYTVDDASRRDMWIRAIALSSVMQLMEESKRVPHLIQQAVDAREDAATRKAERRAQRQFERGSAAEGYSADSATRASARPNLPRLQGRSSAQTDSTITTGTSSAASGANPTGSRGRGSVAASVRQRAAGGSLAGSVRALTAKERARMGAADANGSSAGSVAPSAARTVSLQGRAREGRSRAGDVRTPDKGEGSKVKVPAGVQGEGERESDVMSRDSTDAVSKEASDSLAFSTPSSSLVPSAAVSAAPTNSDAESSSGAAESASRIGTSQPVAAGAGAEGHSALSHSAANDERIPASRRNIPVSSRTRAVQMPPPLAPEASVEERSSATEEELESVDRHGTGAGREDAPVRGVIQVPLVAMRERLRKVEVAGHQGGGRQHARTALAGQSCVDEAPLNPLLAGKARTGGEGGRQRGTDKNEGDATLVTGGAGDGGGHETPSEPPPVPPRRR